ncbi:MAG: OPT/YSL family transporter [Phycisphaerales bacterium]|nr:OPT/YSL family transporter [Phycisphaerales bacterium]
MTQPADVAAQTRTSDAGYPGPADQPRFPPLDLTSPQFTVRAVATGMILAALLSTCNVYVGLKLGWGFNMSIVAALLSYGLWGSLRSVLGNAIRPWGLLENNINQTAGSAGASASSAGLVAAIPALAMLTGFQLTWSALSLWVFVVMLLGILVAIGLRRQLLLVERLPFASGVTSAETLREIFGHHAEATARFLWMCGAAVVAAGAHVLQSAPIARLSTLMLPNVGGFPLRSLGVGFQPSLLFWGVGGLIGFRASLSMLVGAMLAYVAIAPPLIEHGVISVEHESAVRHVAGAAQSATPHDLEHATMGWMLWPGVTLIVVSALTSLTFSWRSIASTFSGFRGAGDESDSDTAELPRILAIAMLLAVMGLSMWCQVSMFGLAWWAAIIAVAMAFVLALVSARVSGETGVTPAGPMGRVTQLLFGGLAPTNVAANLMAGNVTGGAASQCGDLLHDLKSGLLLGASPRLQTLAQIFGAAAGALAGSAVYLILVPDPARQLLTTEWAAPAVAQWKAVAEIFSVGFEAVPAGAPTAMLIAAIAGVLLPVLDRTVPNAWRRWMLSPASLGLALIVPASYSLTIFAGGFAAMLVSRVSKKWTARFLIAVCTGLVVGDSLTGVSFGVWQALGGSGG